MGPPKKDPIAMKDRPKKEIDFQRLERLRRLYLGGEKSLVGRGDYWESEGLLADYDATFGARIRWKWQTVLQELKALGWTPPQDYQLSDWGCGSGSATQSFLAMDFPEPTSIAPYDRSSRAMRFTEQAARKLGFKGDAHPGKPDFNRRESVVLLSHVTTELTEEEVLDLARSLSTAHTIIWVEPGAKESSRKLISARETLRENFSIWAPCTHQAACGLKGSEEHWCHHFAEPPREIFQSAEWREFAKTFKIDLRSLPVSYLVLSRASAPRQVDKARRIGLSRNYKGYCKYLHCRDTGVTERRIQKRDDKKLFQEISEEPFRCIIPANAGEILSTEK